MSFVCLLSSLQQVGLATVSGSITSSLNADATMLGFITASFSYSYAAMQIPSGLIVDITGPRKSVSLALLCASLGTFLFAGALQPAQAVIGRILTGLGLSLVQVPLLKLIAVWFPSKDFGKMAAISFVIGSAGYCVATSPMAWAEEHFGWRLPFMFIAALLALSALLVWLYVRDCPKSSNCDVKKSLSNKNITSILKILTGNRQLWLISFWYLLQVGVYFSFIGLWGGQYLMRVLHCTASEAGWILTPAAAALITAPLFTWIVSRQGKKRQLLMVLPLCSIMLTFPLAFGIESASPILMCMFFFVLSTCSIGGAAVVFDAGKELFPINFSGTVCGFINMFPLAGGALFQHTIGIFIQTQETFGISVAAAFSSAFYVYIVSAVIALVLGFNYKEKSAVTQTCKSLLPG